MNKDVMISELKNGICEVNFTKVDGTDRTLFATLLESLIPEESKPKGTGKEKTDVVSVYVPDLSSWRSFKPENVKSFVNSVGVELNG